MSQNAREKSNTNSTPTPEPKKPEQPITGPSPDDPIEIKVGPGKPGQQQQ